MKILKLIKNKKNKSNEGSTLIELLIAIVLIVSTLTALVSGMTYTMRTLAEAEFRSRATDLAAECMDNIRKNRIVDGWFYFKENVVTEVVDQSGPNPKYDKCGDPGSGDNIQTTFARTPSCEKVNTDDIKCTVEVSWEAFGNNKPGGNNPSVKITQIFKQSRY